MGSGSIAQLLLTSALDADEWSASHPGRFTPGEGAPSAHVTHGTIGVQDVSFDQTNECNGYVQRERNLAGPSRR
jgi:hypothetical protein